LLSHHRKREKKRVCLLCQPAVAGDIIYADLRDEFNTHLAPQACLLRVLLGTTTTVTCFSLSKHPGGSDATSTFSGRHVYLQFTWELGLLPSPMEFSSHRHFYKLSHSWLLGGCCHSCFLQPACFFTVLWGIAPPPSLALRCPALFATCLFCCYCLLFSFFSFFLGWGSV
jgi:hypothetical protein